MKHLMFSTEQSKSSIQAVYTKEDGIFRIDVSEGSHLSSHCFESLDEAMQFAHYILDFALKIKADKINLKLK